MENEWKRILDGNPNANPPIPSQTVEIDIDIVYTANSNSKRPERFVVRQKYGNGTFVRRTPDIQN